MCLIPLGIGFLLKWKKYEVDIRQCLVGTGCALIWAGIVHFWAFRSQAGDYETWSGKVVQTRHFSAWQEYYEYAVYRTESYQTTETYMDGNKTKTRTVTKTRQVFDHWEPTSRWHHDEWKAYSNIGTTYNIDKPKYLYLVKAFGNEKAVRGDRSTSEHNSRMIGGDRNDYVADSPKDIVEPITDVRQFTNRIKSTPSVFNFVVVPDSVKVYEYPKNSNPWKSDRLINTKLDLKQWDQMNARLGVNKKVNVIFVTFDSADSMLGTYQHSKWLGGKKNDLVICKGQGWSKVFGWSESDICKRNLEALVLNAEITNDIIPLIEQEIQTNYTKREFTEDFEYLTVEPQWNHWMVYLLLIVGAQVGIYCGFKYAENNRSYHYRRY